MRKSDKCRGVFPSTYWLHLSSKPSAQLCKTCTMDRGVFPWLSSNSVVVGRASQQHYPWQGRISLAFQQHYPGQGRISLALQQLCHPMQDGHGRSPINRIPNTVAKVQLERVNRNQNPVEPSQILFHVHGYFPHDKRTGRDLVTLVDAFPDFGPARLI